MKRAPAVYPSGSALARACYNAARHGLGRSHDDIPLVFLHDIPGFFIGRDAERKRVAGKIITWMEALGMVTVPRVSIIVRKSYGQAYFNMGGGGYADLLVAWPTA